MNTASLIIAALTIWGLMSFILVVFASMLSSRISREEEMRAMFEEWGQRSTLGFTSSQVSANHEMAESR
ncbi:MAG: hypothetical protein D6755_07650 [Anaerolineae bacterium]|nr:MAG: hypothetical protein D6755_07650 [Anaerolineae bacterium]